MNWDLRVLLLLIVIHSERLYNLSVPKLHRAMAYCEVIFNFPAQKYCHTTNVVYISDTKSKEYKAGRYRSSRPEVFSKKGVLRYFTKFTGKHLCQSVFFNKVAGLRPATLFKKTLAQVFSCEFSEISKNNFSYRTPPVAASGDIKGTLMQI